MVHAVNKNITIDVGFIKKVPDIVVSMSIPFGNIKSCCFKKLKCSIVHDNPDPNEEAAIAYALYETIRDKLVGSGVSVLKNSTSDVSCNVYKNNLTITWHTQATGTAFRKSCGVVLSCLHIYKLYPKYVENMKFLSSNKIDRAVFNTIAKKLVDSLNKIHIVAVGKIKVEDKLDSILEVLVHKLPVNDPPKEFKNPVKRTYEYETKYPVVKCFGIDAAIVADYVRNMCNGVSVGITEEGVIAFTNKIDNKKIDLFIKKYEKITEHLSEVFAYFGLSQGFMDADTALKVLKMKLTPNYMKQTLKKILV